MSDGIRAIHCSFCGAELLFSTLQIESLLCVPPCPRCTEATWLDRDGAPVIWPGII
ncbi:hypothetical protein GS453_07270 [Rhodococcus hoagii]|uniref:Uncharacterized protein n=1 Tax=Rhodococcus hoagii TaxID=43767 RepID=A0AAP2AL65_RHOHA|nr:hypothetical protein [Prescottella equi]MBM4626674.1 hypothetical protein [Prescottella equi]